MPPRYPYVHVVVSEAEAELAADALFELGADGLEQRDDSTLSRGDAPVGVTLVASFAAEADAQAALRALPPSWPARLAFVEGDAWREAWKDFFEPTRIGPRLVIKPSFKPYVEQPGDVVLTLDPGAAFGTGTHESTRLALQAAQRHLASGMHVLDVGSGSGILAIACLLLGAGAATGLDVDAEAVRVGQENAAANAVADRLTLVHGPLAQLPAGRFPLVLANIEARVLVPLADELAARVALGGVLVLSGILATERERLLAAYAALQPLRVEQQGDWIALELRSAPA